MAIRTSDRVVHRFLRSSIRTAVVAHVDPLGHSWGWFADGPPRMHLVPMAPEHLGAARVWLDYRGVRCFRVDRLADGAGLDLEELRESVCRTRDTIESAWLRTCELRGWLAYSGREMVIGIYVGTDNQLTRSLREVQYQPELVQLDVATNSACIGVRANRLIWHGADDGRDAQPE